MLLLSIVLCLLWIPLLFLFVNLPIDIYIDVLIVVTFALIVLLIKSLGIFIMSWWLFQSYLKIYFRHQLFHYNFYISDSAMILLFF